MYIITGAAQSGELWFAQQLRKTGSDCAQEQAFGFELGKLDQTEGEASWLAVPHLTAELVDKHRVLHLVRDPLRQVQHLMFTGFLNRRNNRYDRFAAAWVPSINAAQDHLGRVIRYVAEWDTTLVQLGVPRLHLDLPVIEADRLGAVFKYLVGESVPKKQVNAATSELAQLASTEIKRSRITWDQISRHPDGAVLVERAEFYSYLEQEQRAVEPEPELESGPESGPETVDTEA